MAPDSGGTLGTAGLQFSFDLSQGVLWWAGAGLWELAALSERGWEDPGHRGHTAQPCGLAPWAAPLSQRLAASSEGPAPRHTQFTLLRVPLPGPARHSCHHNVFKLPG